MINHFIDHYIIKHDYDDDNNNNNHNCMIYEWNEIQIGNPKHRFVVVVVVAVCVCGFQCWIFFLPSLFPFVFSHLSISINPYYIYLIRYFIFTREMKWNEIKQKIKIRSGLLIADDMTWPEKKHISNYEILVVIHHIHLFIM